MHRSALIKSAGEKLGTVIAILLIATSLSVFLTYLVPQWYSFLTSKVFVFTNGWDEEFYLSWQGVEAAKNLPGLYPLHLVRAFQMLGVSGAVQNLFLDAVLPPATAFMVYLSLRRLEVPVSTAVGYAVLICFGSVLFNANNPLISQQLGDTRTSGVWFMSPWEVYPTILRTPNPQISFFLIAAAVYGYVRFAKWWLLLLPLPLLYYYTAVSYTCVLLLSFVQAQICLRLSVDWRVALASAFIIVFLALGAGLVVMSFAAGLYQPDNAIRNTAFVFLETRRPQFPVGTLVLATLFILGTAAGLLRLERRWLVAILTLGIASIASANLHIFTGFMMAQKNYYDYGLSALFSIALVLGIEAIRWKLARGAALAIALIYVAIFCYRSESIWLRQATEYGEAIAPGIEKIRGDPFRAIIPNWEATGRVAFSIPQLLSPISYIYWTQAFTQCAMFSSWVENAVAFEKAHLTADSRGMKEVIESTENILIGRKLYKQTKPDMAYCAGADLLNKDFYIVGTK